MRNRSGESSRTRKESAKERESEILSSEEQDAVLKQLSSMLRTTLTFLRIVGVFQIGIGLFYFCLFASGMPPVNVQQVEDRDWLGRYSFPVGETPFGSDGKDAYADLKVDPNNPESLESLKSKADLEAMVEYLKKSQELHMVTWTGRSVLLLTIALLVMGGYSTFKACKLLQVPGALLISTAEEKAAPNSEKQEGEASTPHSRLPMLKPTPDLSSPFAYLKSMALHPLLNHRLWISLSLWPSLYWLLALHVYHRNRNLSMQDTGMPQSFLYLGITDRIMDLIVALWQPVFHVVVAFMLSSMVELRNDLVELASLRYPYEREKMD